MRLPEKIVLRDDPEATFEGDVVEFRLTYAGPLYASGNSNKRVDHKHEIRKAFHPQLKKLWQINKTLAGFPAPDGRGRWLDYLASEYEWKNGYRFVPLVVERKSLSCEINILFLRPEPPGELVSSGDIDGRLKTLFDALSMPRYKSQLGKYHSPEPDEDPFFCLAEDDSLISRLSVETDVLLEPVDRCPLENAARLVIGVKVKPYAVHTDNIEFG